MIIQSRRQCQTASLSSVSFLPPNFAATRSEPNNCSITRSPHSYGQRFVLNNSHPSDGSTIPGNNLHVCFWIAKWTGLEAICVKVGRVCPTVLCTNLTLTCSLGPNNWAAPVWWNLCLTFMMKRLSAPGQEHSLQVITADLPRAMSKPASTPSFVKLAMIRIL